MASDVADRDALRDHYQHCGIPKPEPRKKVKGRKLRAGKKNSDTVRDYIMGRERQLCRCCRIREAQSMHELRFKSLGGKVSRQNSIGTCGQLVGSEPSCHTYLQANQIAYEMDPDVGAEGVIVFTPKTQTAADWMRVALGERLISPPMHQVEEDV